MKRLSSNLQVIDMCLSVDGFLSDFEIVEKMGCHLKTARRLIKSIANESAFLDNIEVDIRIEDDGESRRNKIHKIRVTA